MDESRHRGLDPVITDFYDRTPEEARLGQGPFQLEEARTRELIQRFAPPPPGTILDVGGAAGAYALWLAEAGYRCTWSIRCRDWWRKRGGAAPRPHGRFSPAEWATPAPWTCRTQTADIVLLLGPLYHLTDSKDRVRALQEAGRVLKPGGRLFAAAISRWASALDGLSRDLLADPRFARSWSRISGTVSTETRRSGWITSPRPTSIVPRSWRTR